MAYIKTIPVDSATGDVRTMYERNQATNGYVPNHAKLFSLRPDVNAAWGALIRSIRNTLDSRRYELVTLAAARAMRSSYCMLAHATILRRDFYSEGQLESIAQDHAAAGLDAADVAMMTFADKMVRDASSITAADVEELRKNGFGDGEIFDIAAATAARCFFSKLLDALGAEPDASYNELEEDLRRTLVRGRAISTRPVERVPASNATGGSS